MGGNCNAPRFISDVPSHVIETGYQRYERPIYDYETKYSPCRAHCPAGHDIAWALYLAARGRADLAAATFRAESPFPAITGRVCYAPCERACLRGQYDEPLAIQALERTLGEGNGSPPGRPSVPCYPETVGVVGAGPAGLTCAYHLARLGYEVTVYDANPAPGGVLAFGLPPYRLPRKVLWRELEALEGLGIRFQLNTCLGRDLTFEELQNRHEALFLGLGLSRPRALNVPVPDDERIMAGLHFLRQISLAVWGEERGTTDDGRRTTDDGRQIPPPSALRPPWTTGDQGVSPYREGISITPSLPRLHGEVIVIGGGDVAVDTARSARRVGAERVRICCPEGEAAMLAHPEEIAAAREEGIDLVGGLLPAHIQATAPHLRVEFVAVEELRRGPDGSLTFVTNETRRRTFQPDFLLYAIGQQADLSPLPAALQGRPWVPVNEFGETVLPGVFAGGDLIGLYNVVHAIGSAKRAAIGIDRRLRGWAWEDLSERIRIGPEGAVSMAAYQELRAGKAPRPVTKAVRLEDLNLAYFPPQPRTARPTLSPLLRTGSFQEVNLAWTEEIAQTEAARCFHCGQCNLCGQCFLFCPDSSVIQQGSWGFAIDLAHCKGCGVCVEECPRGAMSMAPEWEVVSP